MIASIVSDKRYMLADEPGRSLANLEPGGLLTAATMKSLAPFIEELLANGWLFTDRHSMFRSYRLRYVSLETNTQCNQRCFFCPVSEHLRPDHTMSDALLESVLCEMETQPDLAGVFLNNYNEPFLDKRAGSIISRLHARNIKVAVNSNGTVPLKSIKPELTKGSIFLLTFNIHTADREKYRRERGRDHLTLVLRNIADYARAGVAQTTRVAVLGDLSDAHEQEFEAIRQAFKDVPVTFEKYRLMDRAGNLMADVSGAVDRDILWGCEQTGSRPLEHLHILPDGRCVLCCEDYYETHVVGDVSRQSFHEVMSGDEMARYRRTIYGFDRPDENFMCRHCEFSIPGHRLRGCAVSPGPTPR
ncbi:MAG: radical SAM/SPASM domain-containing protein [Flavobacteriaceae bacterium]